MNYWTWYHKTLTKYYSSLNGTYDVKRISWDAWNSALEEALKHVKDEEAIKEINKLKVEDYLRSTPKAMKL